MFKKFVSIFLSKFPDRFAYLVIIISIISLGSFAYETVGLPVQMVSAAGVSGSDAATGAAVNWVYMQKCFGDRIKPETVSTAVTPAGSGAYHVQTDFVSLEYKVDMDTGGLHHIPVNHSISMLVSGGKVVSALEDMRDLVHYQVYGPVTDVSDQYL